MKKYLTSLILGILILIGIPFSIAMASPADTASWYGRLTVSNNGTTANTSVATVFTLNVTPMVDLGFMFSSGNNTAIETSTGAKVAYMPGYAGNVWGLWVPQIDANSYDDDVLYTGGTDNMNGKIRYFPGSTGMTIADDASIEPVDNFTVEQSGFFYTDYSTNQTYLDKRDANGKGFLSFNSATGNITSSIIPGIENFTHYTESDANDKLTVTYSTATAVNCDRDEDVLLYKNYGSGYFDDLNVKFEILISSASQAGALAGGPAFTNTPNVDITGLAATDINFGADQAGTLHLFRGNLVASDYSVGCALDVPYYCTMTRAAGNDSVSVKIYDDAARTSLVDTLTVAGFGATKYQYVYGFINFNDGGGGKDFDGYVKDLDLDLDDIEVTAGGLDSAEYTVETSMESPFLSLGIDANETSSPVTNTILSAIPHLLSFNGVDSTYPIAHDANQLLTTGGSIEAWIKPDTIGELSGRIVDKSSNLGGVDGYTFALSATNRIYIQMNGGVLRYSDTGSVIFGDGNWYHVVATWGATGSVLIYVNGIDATLNPGISADPAGITTGNDQTIGNRSGATDRTFDGLIGKVNIYNTVLTPAQIAASYAMGEPTAPITPVADDLTLNAPLWQLEEYAPHTGTFKTVDSIGHTATVTNAVWALDEGYTFDGAGDFINMGVDASLGVTTEDFTLLVWAYLENTGAHVVMYGGSTLDAPALYSRNNEAILLSKPSIANAPAANTAMPEDTWVQMAIVFNSTLVTNNLTYYFNGVPDGIVTFNQDFADFFNIIGATNNGANTPWDGKIGEVQFYKDKLFSPSEILQNYNATKSKYTTGDIYTYSTLVGVPGNANDYIVSYNATMPYILHNKIWIDGVLRSYIEWEYGTTFTDLSGNGNDGIPSFITASADPFISASLASFLPISEAKAPAYTLDDPPDFITITPGVSANFTTTNTLNITAPGWPVIRQIAVAGGVPERLLATISSALLLLMVSFAISYMFRANKNNNMVIKVAVIFALMCVLTAVRFMDVWQVYFFAIIAVGCMWISRQREVY